MSYLAGTGVIITSGVSTAVAAVAAVQAACEIEEFPRPHIMLCKGPRMYTKHSWLVGLVWPLTNWRTLLEF